MPFKSSIIQTSIFITCALFLLLSDKSAAQSFMANDGYVEFVSTAPLLEFKGVSENLTGLIDLETMMIDFYVDLNTLETGIRRRDRDMRSSYLETDKFPFAEFSGKLMSEFDPNLTAEQEVKATGTFRIHGVKKEIDVVGTLTPNGNALQLNASWVVLLEDYNIARPKVLFYELAEEQTVNISIQLVRTVN